MSVRKLCNWLGRAERFLKLQDIPNPSLAQVTEQNALLDKLHVPATISQDHRPEWIRDQIQLKQPFQSSHEQKQKMKPSISGNRI